MSSESDHAKKRMKERLGANKQAIHRMAVNALNKGITHSETSGSLKRFMDYLFLSHKTATNLRIYNNAVFLFDKREHLITVIKLPGRYNSVVKRINNSKKECDLMNVRIDENFNIRKGTLNYILEKVLTDEGSGKESFIIIGYYKNLDKLYEKLAAGGNIIKMKYGDLIANPKNGIYRTENGTYVVVDGARIVHSPSSRSIKDDEMLETVKLDKSFKEAINDDI